MPIPRKTEESPRLTRERRTLTRLFTLFCGGNHGTTAGLCAGCGDLLAYALARLHHCPFQHRKPTCARCPIHCYGPAWRQRIQDVMRYAGPRLALDRPLLAIAHLLDGLRPIPRRKRGKG